VFQNRLLKRVIRLYDYTADTPSLLTAAATAAAAVTAVTFSIY